MFFENEIHGDENILEMNQGQICLLIHGTAKILWKWDIPDSFYFVGENIPCK